MLSDNGKILAQLISDFSEEWWFAGWLENIEHTIWMLGNRREDSETHAQAKRIVDKGKEWGIWVRWQDDAEMWQGLYVEELPIDEWIKLHKEEVKWRKFFMISE